MEEGNNAISTRRGTKQAIHKNRSKVKGPLKNKIQVIH